MLQIFLPMLACFVISKAKAAVALLEAVELHITTSGFAGYGRTEYGATGSGQAVSIT